MGDRWLGPVSDFLDLAHIDGAPLLGVLRRVPVPLRRADGALKVGGCPREYAGLLVVGPGWLRVVYINDLPLDRVLRGSHLVQRGGLLGASLEVCSEGEDRLVKGCSLQI